MNKCSEKDCPHYVIIYIFDGKKKETNYSKGFYECDSCFDIYCADHTRDHTRNCRGAMGARLVTH